MPRPPTRCGKDGCRNVKSTCLLHPRKPWGGGNQLPNNWTSLRNLVAVRDGKRCRICGTTVQLELDHIVERSDGGPDDPANLRLLCKQHHTEKTHQAARDRRQRRKR